MNPNQPHETEAIRSDIDVTRRRMDETIDALGERMQPRHLLDEALGYFRRTDEQGNSNLSNMREKISSRAGNAVHAVTSSAGTAMHAVTDTIKQNPLPALLIGAGVAWMVYNSRRASTATGYSEYLTDTDDDIHYDPDAHLDRPLEYPASVSGISEAGWSESAVGQPVAGESDSKLGRLKDGIGSAASSAKDKLSHAGEAAREKMSAFRHAAGEKFSAARVRAGELGSRVKQRSGELYTAGRERVVTTADHHPLETGLVCLAAGVLAGLALPTPSPVNRRLGPTADRLRDRARESGREMLEKGKHVATAAMSAAKQEAQQQGLTPERLREKANAVAERAKQAGQSTARDEGLTTGSMTGNQGRSTPEGNQSGSQLNDPTIARPTV